MKSCVLNKVNIVGVRNSKIIFSLKNYDNKISVILVCDGKTKECSVYTREKDLFIFDEILDNAKKIEIVLKNGKNKTTIFETKNKLYKRFFSKISFLSFSFINRMLKIVKNFFVRILNPFRYVIKVIKFLWKEHRFLVPPSLWKKYFNILLKKVRKSISFTSYNPFNVNSYNKWIKNCESFSELKRIEYNPLISILIPVYNIERDYLSKCLDSILNQTYSNFEVCLADDNSSKDETIETLKEYEKRDSRIKVVYRKENGHISRATNSALEIAKGEYIALMDNDDELSPHALYEMVLVLNSNKDIDMVYSDEDKLDMEGNRCEPHFKSDYAPDSLLGGNYICHFEILRKSIVEEIGGFDPEMVGAQDFDLFLKFVEKSTPDRIYHIPKILYHWRKIPGSTADTIENKEYAIEAGRRAVENALLRRGLKGKVELPIKSTHYLVDYLYDKEPKVSIIIPTKDKVEMLKSCVDSILKKTKYKNYEVIIVDNNSVEKDTFKYFDTLKKNRNIKVIKYENDFNYSAINNYAVSFATGEYYLFLNNDTKVITPTWINSMVGYAIQDHIGAVGTKLLYPNDTIQHGGVILDITEVAKHTFLKYDRESYGWYGRLLTQYNYSAVTAACLMVSKDKFKSVNGFNENLKVAYNDVDFCLNLLDKKLYNVFLPSVELYHYESISRGLDSTSEKYNLYIKERNIMIKNHNEKLNKDRFYNPNLSFEDDFMLKKEKTKFNFKFFLIFFLVLCFVASIFFIDNTENIDIISSNTSGDIVSEPIITESIVQEILPSNEDFNTISIQFATYNRVNNSDFEFVLYKNDDDIVRLDFNSRDLLDNNYYSFSFPAVECSDKDDCFFVIKPISVHENNFISVYFSEETGNINHNLSFMSENHNNYFCALFFLTLILLLIFFNKIQLMLKKFMLVLKKSKFGFILNFFPNNFYVFLLFIFVFVNVGSDIMSNDLLLRYDSASIIPHENGITEKLTQTVDFEENFFDTISIQFATYARKNFSSYVFDFFVDNKLTHSEEIDSSILEDGKYFDILLDEQISCENKECSFEIYPIKYDSSNVITVYKNADTNDIMYSLSLSESSNNLFVFIVAGFMIIIYFIVSFLINTGRIKKITSFLLLTLVYIIPVLFIIPILSIPDEEYHFNTAYKLSMFDLSNDFSIMVPENRECMYYIDYSFKSNLSDYDSFKDCFESKEKVPQDLSIFKNNLVQRISYIPSSVGIKFADIFTNAPYFLFYSGRLFSLLFSFVILLLSFKFVSSNIHKLILLVVSMPMFVHQLISYSYDSLLLSLSILLSCMILNFVTNKKRITSTMLVLYALITYLIFIIKAPYALLSLFIIFLNGESFGGIKKKIITIFLMLIGFVFVYYLVDLFNPEVVSSSNNLHLENLTSNPLNVFNVAFHTVKHYWFFYLNGIVGIFGWLKIYMNPLYIYIYLFFLFFVALSINIKINFKYKIALLCLSMLIVGGIFLSMYIGWNPVVAPNDFLVIHGVQGRYFVPLVFILLSLFFGTNKKIKIKDVTVMHFVNIFYIIMIFTLLIAFY